jgi:hypothetical protein
MATYTHNKAEDARDRKHPQPVQRQGSAIGVPKGAGGKADFATTSKGPATKVAEGPPGGGRKKDTAYAVPSRNRNSGTEHQENTTSQAGGSLPGSGMPAASNPAVFMQPHIPFDQNNVQTQGSGQGFPYGSQRGGFGFDRLRGGR